jgi:opacity protein-like surface antigen
MPKTSIKFLILLSILSLSINFSFASNPWDPRNKGGNPYDGAYMGINLGLDYSKNKVVSSHPTFYHTSHVSFNGYLGGLLLGYGKTINEVYTGTEISLNLFNSQGGTTSHSVDNALQTHTTRHAIEKNRDIAASIRVGKLLDNRFLVYTKFQGGLEDLSFSYFFDDGLNYTNKKIRKKVPHVKLGVGADWLVSNRVALGIAYDYKIPKNMTHTADDIKNDHTIDSSILSFRVIYYF